MLDVVGRLFVGMGGGLQFNDFLVEGYRVVNEQPHEAFMQWATFHGMPFAIGMLGHCFQNRFGSEVYLLGLGSRV